MNEVWRAERAGGQLSTRVLQPRVQRFGSRDIEVTYLGTNSEDKPTWILWNSAEPYLIGMLSEGKLGYTFEQRTDHGVLLHENISFNRVQRAIGGGF